MRGSAAGAVVNASIAKCTEQIHSHSLAKVLSWRVIETATTALIAFAITGKIDTGLLIGGIELFLKIDIYHLHVRFWMLLT